MEHLLSESLFPTKRPSKKCLTDQDMDTDDEQGDVKNESKKDPLSSQIWRLYTKAKDNLPNGSRLENITWRMMAMTLKKKNKSMDNSAGMQDDRYIVTTVHPYLHSSQIVTENTMKQTMLPKENETISMMGPGSHENSHQENIKQQQNRSSICSIPAQVMFNSFRMLVMFNSFIYISIIPQLINIIWFKYILKAFWSCTR